MKILLKVILLPFLMLPAFSCNTDDFLPQEPVETNTATNHDAYETYEANADEIQLIAEEFLDNLSCAEMRGRNFTSREASVTRIKKDISRSAEYPQGFYLFNYSEGGFILISADTRDYATVYLASEKGYLDEQAFHSDFYKYLLELASESQNSSIIYSYENESAINRSRATNEAFIREEKYDTLLNIRPRLPMSWDQGFPYNKRMLQIHPETPKSDLGCTTIALGQIMAYKQKPSSILGVNLDWQSILKFKSINDYPTIDYWPTANFLYNLGKELGINYDSDDRGRTINHMRAVLNKYNYTYSISSYNTSGIINSLANNCPVLMTGISNDNHGHAWVCDGASTFQHTVTFYHEDGTIVKNHPICSNNVIERRYYIHLNPGWGPNYNKDAGYKSYWTNTVSEPQTWVMDKIFNFGEPGALQSYNNNVNMICNIK